MRPPNNSCEEILTSPPVPFLRVTKDVGEAVKIIVAHPEDFVGQEVALGDIVQTIREQGEAISTATGHRVEVVQGPIPDIPQVRGSSTTCCLGSQTLLS